MSGPADPFLPAMEAVCKALDAPREVCDRCGGKGLVTLFGVPNGIGYEMDADDQPCPECRS